VKVNIGAHGQREGLGGPLGDVDDGEGRHGRRTRRCARATLNGARYLGLRRRHRLARGGQAGDLVVIDGDVLQDIRVSDRVTHVVLNGGSTTRRR
jgi:cytosine/adenosine deaminase-related metal-dependent hydrolase